MEHIEHSRVEQGVTTDVKLCKACGNGSAPEAVSLPD